MKSRELSICFNRKLDIVEQPQFHSTTVYCTTAVGYSLLLTALQTVLYLQAHLVSLKRCNNITVGVE